MPLDDRTLRYLASLQTPGRDVSMWGAQPQRPTTLAGSLQQLGTIGNRRPVDPISQRQTIVAGPGQGRQQTINVNAGTSAPAGAAMPSTADESSLASQAGWAGANEAVAPYLGDWRATPAQILAAAVGGYQRSRYAAQQDIAAQRQQEQLFGLKKQELEATQAEARAKAKQREDLMAEIDGIQDPEQRRLAKLNPDAWVTARAQQIMPEPITPYQQASLGQNEQQLALEAQRIAIARAEAAKGATPEWIAVQDPSDPNKAIYLDKRSGQPMVVGGQLVRPASQRDAGAGFTQSKDLRTAFDKQAQDIRDVVTSYRKIDAGFKERSGPGDIAGIFGFMKMLDPTSVVREGEFATAANSGGVPDWLRSQYNKLISGEKLADNQRGEILSAARSQIGPYHTRYGELSKTYTDLATGFGVDPASVVTPLEFPQIPSPEVKGSTMYNQTGEPERPPSIDNGSVSPAALPPINSDDILDEGWGPYGG